MLILSKSSYSQDRNSWLPFDKGESKEPLSNHQLRSNHHFTYQHSLSLFDTSEAGDD
jgi:hypothetical protein